MNGATRLVAWALVAGVLAATVACNRAERAFERARASRSEDALRAFTEEYASSPLVDAARAHLEDVRQWNSAAEQVSREAFHRYLESYPDGLFAAEAREGLVYAGATVQDVQTAYDGFLELHPDGFFGERARARREALSATAAAYRDLEKSTDVVALRRFIDEHAATGYARAAEERLSRLATEHAEAALLGRDPYRGLPDRLDGLDAFLRETAPGQRRRAAEEARVRVLLERARFARRAEFAAASVPLSSAPPLSETVSLQDAKSVTVEGNITGNGFGLAIRGLYASRDGALSRSLAWGTGSLIVNDPERLMDNFPGSLTISQTGESRFRVASYFPGDRILVSGLWTAMRGGGSTAVVLPGGDGTIYRFTDTVDGFFPGVRIVSSSGSFPSSGSSISPDRAQSSCGTESRSCFHRVIQASRGSLNAGEPSLSPRPGTRHAIGAKRHASGAVRE
jgi:hypothetical protein